MAGRGRGRPGGLKGVTWEYDPSIKLESKPIELFPPHPNLKRPAPLTDKEKREIGHYKRLQRQVHRGPLYTQPTKRDATAPAKTFGEDQFNRQYSTNPKADFDPFTGVETYSQRLQPKVNEIPKFSGRPFNKELFPKELWPALEGEAGNQVRKHLDRANEKKAAMMAGVKDKKPDDKHARVLEKLFSVPVDEDAEEVDEDQEQDAGIEVDSNFDDESMGGDYDAEQYFDNGEDNSEGEGGGGDDDY
ncbi:hypothetical protein L207DRAFT_551781 [Hyaloscypha variabilis F]|uniref:DNA-directed RNA polymerase III subunit n=1 Tax=Hyaloscypha variabilis (strain UAMH 11265 / GT02V1 / F) TaxID=1149755 RepID=A0A2J6S819_HYAVF|nr:hypothetical protein L207DRAFT_551781 [Hyaloscypha variabilis F]